MQPEQQQRIMGYFIEEAKEHLNTIEQGVLNLQRTIDDPEMTNELFRAAHSVKGGAAMLGLNSIQRVSHRLEDFFKILREAPGVQVDQKLEGLFLQVFDALQELLNQLQGPFGLTEETANATVAGVEPTFIELEQHLDQLTSGISKGAPVLARASQDIALRVMFEQDVPAQLREMLQLFKQSEVEPSVRAQLQGICRRLSGIGETFSLRQWCQLIETARRAIATPENSFRTLAPIVIRDIKQAQEMVLSDREVEIAPGTQLIALAPEETLTGGVENLTDVLDITTDLVLELPADTSVPDTQSDEPTFATAADTTLDAGLDEAFADSPLAERNGPEVGLAELNTLADLFEGEMPDLGSTWQAEEELHDTTPADQAETDANSFDAASDFSDLLFETPSPRSASVPSDDVDLNDLFGDALFDEASESSTRDRTDLQTADLDEFLAMTGSETGAEAANHPGAVTELSLDELLASPTPEADGSLDNLGELFSGLDESDFGSELATNLSGSLAADSLGDADDAFAEALPADNAVDLPSSIADPWQETQAETDSAFDFDDLLGSEAAGSAAEAMPSDRLDQTDPTAAIEELFDPGEPDFGGLFNASEPSDTMEELVAEELVDTDFDLATESWLADTALEGSSATEHGIELDLSLLTNEEPSSFISELVTPDLAESAPVPDPWEDLDRASFDQLSGDDLAGPIATGPEPIGEEPLITDFSLSADGLNLEDLSPPTSLPDSDAINIGFSTAATDASTAEAADLDFSELDLSDLGLDLPATGEAPTLEADNLDLELGDLSDFSFDSSDRSVEEHTPADYSIEPSLTAAEPSAIADFSDTPFAIDDLLTDDALPIDLDLDLTELGPINELPLDLNIEATEPTIAATELNFDLPTEQSIEFEGLDSSADSLSLDLELDLSDPTISPSNLTGNLSASSAPNLLFDDLEASSADLLFDDLPLDLDADLSEPAPSAADAPEMDSIDLAANLDITPIAAGDDFFGNLGDLNAELGASEAALPLQSDPDLAGLSDQAFDLSEFSGTDLADRNGSLTSESAADIDLDLFTDELSLDATPDSSEGTLKDFAEEPAIATDLDALFGEDTDEDEDTLEPTFELETLDSAFATEPTLDLDLGLGEAELPGEPAPAASEFDLDGFDLEAETIATPGLEAETAASEFDLSLDQLGLDVEEATPAFDFGASELDLTDDLFGQIETPDPDRSDATHRSDAISASSSDTPSLEISSNEFELGDDLFGSANTSSALESDSLFEDADLDADLVASSEPRLEATLDFDEVNLEADLLDFTASPPDAALDQALDDELLELSELDAIAAFGDTNEAFQFDDQVGEQIGSEALTQSEAGSADNLDNLDDLELFEPETTAESPVAGEDRLSLDDFDLFDSTDETPLSQLVEDDEISLDFSETAEPELEDLFPGSSPELSDFDRSLFGDDADSLADLSADATDSAIHFDTSDDELSGLDDLLAAETDAFDDELSGLDDLLAAETDALADAPAQSSSFLNDAFVPLAGAAGAAALSMNHANPNHAAPSEAHDELELHGLEFAELSTDADNLAELDELLETESSSADEFADFDDLLASPSPTPIDTLTNLDDLLDESTTQIPVGDEFGDLDNLLSGDTTAPREEFENLDSLLESETTAPSDSFADLDDLLSDQPIANADSAFNLSGADSPNLDDFADLEALLEQPAEATPTTSDPAIAKDKGFDELDDLLKDAEQKMGGSPTIKAARSLTPQNRRMTRPGRVFSEQTMRVPVKHLDNLSNLVGELVVNRNSLEQDQERLRQSLDNLLYQVQQLGDVGQRMQDLYERSLLESSLLASRQNYRMGTSSTSSSQTGSSTSVEYDPLEMDRFTGFHSLSQEMIELIVRVRESASDIEFVVDETDQVTRMFRQVTTQLQEGLTRSRMVPFAQTADRMPRAVRDISMKVGKQAELVIEGRETLIDKMILEQLYDPMTHLVNNALTHGIESPEVRRNAGKPAAGRITIRAFHQGNQTIISVSDDGAGIDVERVKAKALEKGLLTPAEARTLTRLDAYDLLFHAGFSTKDQADDFSGRGVGMDVVRTSLSEIRGVINTDSTPGKGTTFTIRLPLTLSISKALCCISDRARIAFPMDGVEDMLDVPKERIQTNAEGQPCISWRDSILPLRPLEDLLGYSRHLSRGNVYGGHQEDDIVSIVVLRSAGNFLALQVDQVLGEQEIVIKQLEGPVPKPVGVAGATVLGDGRIMPIADVLELIDLSMGRIRRDVGGPLWEQDGEQGVLEPAATKTEPMVLIVDDSITVRELLSMTFNKVGYRVEQARDGQEAWEKLRSGLPCDIVFCDIEMPRMDGLELLSRIQKDGTLSHLPIAMLTSRGADRHRQMAASLGASGYFTKPYLEEALLDAAQRMLKGERLL